jgi:hypothetical protein
MTKSRPQVRVQDLLGRQVRAGNNQSVGRIEEIRAERRGAGFVVTEYHVGPAALLERLSATVGRWFGGESRLRVIAWDQIDVRDPRHPRLLVEAGALAWLDQREEDAAGRGEGPPLRPSGGKWRRRTS